ncbi:MAG: hypothetical protein ALECFALPRED_011101 [Alectoria fallacina]|uniref:WKF domain-containing protein n=1 Tax=Alectoria fallacina TaxID=1903189 RepID=A0A8H3F522_9LECA|nr:MAG: hypothetical protein ALECFALPRED_011101 [Alectoria fallacina]
MSPIPEPIQKLVPAWKKLGLKLKFAKEEPEDTQPRQNGTANCKKRKTSASDEGVVEYALIQGSAKKAKKSKPRAEEVGEAANGNGSSHEPRDVDKTRKKVKKLRHVASESAEAVNDDKSMKEPANFEQPPKKIKKSEVKADDSTVSANGNSGRTHEQGSSPPPTLRTTPASKGKSVSFTPDTKTKDGDSVKGLYKTWIAKQIAVDPSFDPSTVSPALRSVAPSIVASPESPSPASVPSPSTSISESSSKKATKPTKKAKTRLPKTSSGPGPPRFDPVLTYLTTHHTSPQNWKFSKPHQNQILKHLFSITHIPSSYDPALLSYIRGLEGTSARSRIRKEALSIVEEDEKWLASEPSETEKMENETVAQCNARRHRDYEAAVAIIKHRLREKEGEREERDWELLGEKEEWEERVRKRRRAEIVLWNVGEEEEAAEGDSVALTRRNAFGGNPGRPMKSGIAQLVQATRDPGPAPRLGRGVGMGMGGVEVIDAGGIARGSQGKKVVFGDDGAAQAGGTNNVNGFGRAHGFGQPNGANGAHAVKMSDAGMKPKRKRKRKRRTGVPDDDESSSESSSGSGSGNGENEDQQQQHQQQPHKVNTKRGANEPSGDETSSSGSGSGTSSSGDSDSE